MWAWIRKHGKKIAIAGGIILLIGLTFAIPPIGVAGWIAAGTAIAADVIVSIGVTATVVGTALTVAGIAGGKTEVEHQHAIQVQEKLQQYEQRAQEVEAEDNQINNNAAQNTGKYSLVLEVINDLAADREQEKEALLAHNEILDGMQKAGAQQHHEVIELLNNLHAQISGQLGQHGIFSANNPNPAASPKAPGASDLAQRPRGFSPVPNPSQ